MSRSSELAEAVGNWKKFELIQYVMLKDKNG